MSSTIKPEQTFGEKMKHAAKRALGGGLPGAAAMGIQVTSLMWMRTTMNYQYRHGTSTTQALKKLYAEGGVLRFYRGYSAAMLQGPLSRFGDTAANSGMLALLDSTDVTKNLPVSIKTSAASASAALFRILLMPIDTVKTIMQVEGKDGFKHLRAKMKVSGVSTLYHGSLAASGATFVGHYPWFFTHNYLQEKIPRETIVWRKLTRNAIIGFTSSVVSDTISNSIRVIKTTKQTSTTAVTYPQALKMVLDHDGVAGLFGRGLKTRLIANGMQGMMFTVLWKMFEEKFNKLFDKPKQ